MSQRSASPSGSSTTDPLPTRIPPPIPQSCECEHLAIVEQGTETLKLEFEQPIRVRNASCERQRLEISPPSQPRILMETLANALENMRDFAVCSPRLICPLTFRRKAPSLIANIDPLAEFPQHAPSERIRPSKSADRRVATVATQRAENIVEEIQN